MTSRLRMMRYSTTSWRLMPSGTLQKIACFSFSAARVAGKTAIVRHFSEGTAATVSRALSLRGYPWNLHAQRIDRGASEIEAYVSSWRYLLVSQLAALVLSKVGGDAGPEATSIREFFRDNYGGPNVELSRLLRPQRLRKA